MRHLIQTGRRDNLIPEPCVQRSKFSVWLFFLLIPFPAIQTYDKCTYTIIKSREEAWGERCTRRIVGSEEKFMIIFTPVVSSWWWYDMPASLTISIIRKTIPSSKWGTIHAYISRFLLLGICGKGFHGAPGVVAIHNAVTVTPAFKTKGIIVNQQNDQANQSWTNVDFLGGRG